MRDGEIPARPPPHNDDAEMALLGALLHDNRVYARVADILRPEHFANRLHDRIYTAISRLVERGRVADPITLRQAFATDPDLQDAGEVGAAYLMRLSSRPASAATAPDYARAIVDLYQRRAIIDACEAIMRDAYADDLDRDAGQQIEAAVDRLSKLEAGARTVEDATPAIDPAALAVQHAWDLHHGRVQPITGIPWGLRALEEIIPGMGKGRLIVVAGRPGMGKTSFGMQVAEGAALTGPVLVASLEMSADELTQRMLARRSWVPVKRQSLGPLSAADCERLDMARDEIASLPLFIADRPAQTMGQIRAAARRIKAKYKGMLALILIDNLNLIKVKGVQREGNRVSEVTEITGECKALSKEMDCPVVLLCQLNRSVESREDKVPNPADLRDSGSIEQDADVILFPYRAEYYLSRDEPAQRLGETHDKFTARYADWTAQYAAAKGRAEIIVAKHRQGECGVAHVAWDGGRFTFEDQR